MNDNTIPDWVYETLKNDNLRVYENSNGKIIISQVNERYAEDIMTPQAIIDYLRTVRKKPVVMHPRICALGRHVPKRDVIAVLSERIMTQLEGGRMTLEIDHIYCGDCLDLMKEIPDKSVNLVLTDPPYGIGYQSNRCKDGPRFEKIVNDDAPCIEWLPDAFRVTSPDGSLVCFCRWDVEGEFKEAIEECGYRVKSQIVWDRVVHGMGDLKGQFAPRHDVAWFATVSERFEFKGQRPPSVLAFQRPPPEAMIHPTQKPIALFERLILSLTSPGDTVLDPFLGSGTTAIACLRTGRHYIGIEKHEPYFLKAQERIDKERAQVRLFDSPYLHECLVRQRREELGLLDVDDEPAGGERR